jgi:hypothetical protein
MRAPTESEPRNDESLIPTVVPVAADDHRRRELDEMEIEREGDRRIEEERFLSSSKFSSKISCYVLLQLEELIALSTLTSWAHRRHPLPLHAHTLTLPFSEDVLPELRLHYSGASLLVAVTCSPKGVVHHQVEDGERVLLAADADAIPQQLGEGPTPLAGAAARG